jgi:hypothetical protein
MLVNLEPLSAFFLLRLPREAFRDVPGFGFAVPEAAI